MLVPHEVSNASRPKHNRRKVFTFIRIIFTNKLVFFSSCKGDKCDSRHRSKRLQLTWQLPSRQLAPRGSSTRFAKGSLPSVIRSLHYSVRAFGGDVLPRHFCASVGQLPRWHADSRNYRTPAHSPDIEPPRFPTERRAADSSIQLSPG